MHTQNIFSEFLNKLISISPRRGKNEQIAATLIKSFLDKENISFKIQTFTTKIPEIISAELVVDGKKIPCIGASFQSGEITNDVRILNAFGAKADTEMIVFNPVSQGICLQSYKNVPAVAVHRDSVVDLVMANNISGKVEVKELEFESSNILVGNTDNPKKIIFAHYDSLVGAGAVDNAAAVDVLFQTIKSNASLVKTHLFVFAGSEEESISSHDGCYGFEIFDREYKTLIDNAEEILVLDGVGVGNPIFVSNHIDWVFAVSRIKDISSKVYWMQNDQSKVMKYYHTDLDTIETLNCRYIDQAYELLTERLTKNSC